MNVILGILFVALSLAVWPSFGQPLNADATALFATAPGRGEAASAVTATATVAAIDRSERIVTFEGRDGGLFQVVAGPEIRNFDQIEVGDELRVTHLEHISLELMKGGTGIRSRVVSESADRAAPGQQPAADAVRRVVVIANVLALDPVTQTVTLRGPERIVDLRVRDPEQFGLVEVGDQVRAEFNTALAISMEPASAAR
jgi:hypothetical protein